jgi:hypothetical protein
MSVQMVQAKIKAEGLTDVQAAAKKMFAAIDAEQPEGIRYASCLLPDGETFVALLQVDEGVEKPLPALTMTPGSWTPRGSVFSLATSTTSVSTSR